MKFEMLRAETELDLNQGLEFHADLVIPFIGRKHGRCSVSSGHYAYQNLTSHEGGSLGETLISRPSEKQTNEHQFRLGTSHENRLCEEAKKTSSAALSALIII